MPSPTDGPDTGRRRPDRDEQTASATSDPARPARPTRRTVSELIGAKGVIAVVEIADADDASELAAVLADAGIAALEITLRTDDALPAIEAAAARGGLHVGAGTVVRAEQATASLDCGARFLVSPGYDPRLARFVGDLDAPYLPGVLSPSEIQTAIGDGFTELKLFPVERFGGLALVDTFAPIFPGVTFVPSGGIRHELAGDYLRHPSVTAIGGSWIAPAALVRNHDWAEITRRAEAIRTLQHSWSSDPNPES